MFEEDTNVETYETWFALVRMKFLRGTCAKLHSTPRWKEVEKEEKIQMEHVVDAVAVHRFEQFLPSLSIIQRSWRVLWNKGRA